MTLVLIEGFDHMTLGELPQKHWNGTPFRMIPGRSLGANSQGVEAILANPVSKFLPSSYSKVTVGFALHPGDFHTKVLELRAGAAQVAGVSIDLTGKLEIRNGENTRYPAFVDIHKYANAVEPGVLNSLLYERSEFIETQSFSILPRREAMRALELRRDQLIASDDVVESQVAEMDVALNELGDGQFCMGEYHYSLVVFGEDVADAGRRAAQAMGAVGEACSQQMRPVDLVADAAWFAQMPGNRQWRPREAKLSSRAFAALASGHNFTRGKRDGNPWGEALVLLRTPSGQPFYLNLHKSPEDEDSADWSLPREKS